MDTLTASQRSALMSKIRSGNTKPELVVRTTLHRLGFRFRLHRKDLPGRPDIVLPKHRKVIFVHGCFWHGHTCKLASKPKTNSLYWSNKIQLNKERDSRNRIALELQGWVVLELWECEIRRSDGVGEILKKFLLC